MSTGFIWYLILDFFNPFLSNFVISVCFVTYLVSCFRLVLPAHPYLSPFSVFHLCFRSPDI